MGVPRILLSLFLLTSGSILPQPELIPVQARQIRTMVVYSEDSPRVAQRWLDTRLRNSRGALYERSEMLDERDRVVKTTITMTEPDGIQYTINESSKAILIERSPLHSRNMGRGYSPNAKRTKYLGRDCVVLLLNAPPGSGRSGEVWVDEETSFLLYRRTEIVLPDRVLARTIETVEFIVGVEPDEDIFRVPDLARYQVIDRLGRGR